MCVDLEHDDDPHGWTWEHIEGSADYILLPARGHDYKTDDYQTGEFVTIVKYLQRVASHVRWRITVAGSDDDGADPRQWRIICVPESQLPEAQQIFARFLSGDNLANYCYTDKYSEIYDKRQGQRSELKAEIVSLRDALVEYDEILSDESDLLRVLERLAVVLPRIYSCANQLPDVPHAPDFLGSSTHIARPRTLAVSPDDPEIRTYDPFVADLDGFSLAKLLVSIRDDIEESLDALVFEDPDAIATATNDLRFGFAREDGWGHDLVIALSEVHRAKAKVAKERKKDRQGR